MYKVTRLFSWCSRRGGKKEGGNYFGRGMPDSRHPQSVLRGSWWCLERRLVLEGMVVWET